MISDTDLAYAAGIIDALALLKTRKAGDTHLPEILIQSARWPQAATLLADMTGVAPQLINKTYDKHNCTAHCPSAHQHIESVAQRWQVTGARATIVLYGVQPYLRYQQAKAEDLIERGLSVGWKSNVVAEMSALGWEIPELKDQPRAVLSKAADLTEVMAS